MNESNEPSESIWKRPWRDGRGVVLWLLIVACFAFIVLFLLGLAYSQANVGGEVLEAFLGAIGLAIAGAFGVVAFHWLRYWPNLRRALFGLVCLITLIALFYAEEDWRGKQAWESYRKAQAAKGEKFDLISLAPPPVPDDQNLALSALLKPIFDFSKGKNGLHWRDTNGYARVMSIQPDLQDGKKRLDAFTGDLRSGTFADLQGMATFYRGNTNYPQAAASAKAPEVILVALGKFDPQLEELKQAAARRPECRFPLNYQADPPASMLLPHLAPLKRICVTLELRAVARLAMGQAESAYSDLRLAFRLSDCLRREPILISHLVRMSMLGLDLEVVREGLVRHEWDKTQLGELGKELGSIHLLSEYEHAMRGERAIGIGDIDWLRRQGWGVDPGSFFSFPAGEDLLWKLQLRMRFMPSGWYYQNMLSLSRLEERYLLAPVDVDAHRVYPKKADMQQALEKAGGPHDFLVRFLLPPLARAPLQPAWMQTYVDAGRVACALGRYRLDNGRLPEKLESLVSKYLAKVPGDVMDGGPLKYQAKSDGSCVIYSVGWNGKDDGGKTVFYPGRGKHRPVNRQAGDWVWAMPAAPAGR